MKFFPAIDQEKLAEVEGFHSKLVGLLRSELRASENELRTQLEQITSEISQTDPRIGQVPESVDQPTIIVDRVYELANNLSVARPGKWFV